MKSPYCQEKINKGASVCKHRDRDLSETRSSHRYVIHSGAIAVVVLCLAVFACSSPEEEPQSEDEILETAPTNTVVPLAPSYEEIAEKAKSMAEVEREAYYRTMTGLRVEGWTGWVHDVDVGFWVEDYTLWVDMDPPDSLEIDLMEIWIPISDDLALELSQGQQITFSGIIDYVREGLSHWGSAVYLVEGATIEWSGALSAGVESGLANTPVLTTSPPYEEISEKVSGMTEAQWKAYLPTLSGLRIEGWTGVVYSVVDHDQSNGSEYTLWVNMEPGPVLSEGDVAIPISEAIALELEPGQQVTFSGIIASVFEFVGTVEVHLEEGATIEW